MSDGLKRRRQRMVSSPEPHLPHAGRGGGRLVRRPNVSWIWCGKHLVRKSGSNLDTENNFVEFIDETLNLTP